MIQQCFIDMENMFDLFQQKRQVIYKLQQYCLFFLLRGTRSFCDRVKTYLCKLEQFSIECRKTKTKVITLANRNRVNNTTSQSEFEANTCNRRQARENARGQNTIGFGLDSHWLRKWREFC